MPVQPAQRQNAFGARGPARASISKDSAVVRCVSVWTVAPCNGLRTNVHSNPRAKNVFFHAPSSHRFRDILAKYNRSLIAIANQILLPAVFDIDPATAISQLHHLLPRLPSSSSKEAFPAAHARQNRVRNPNSI